MDYDSKINMEAARKAVMDYVGEYEDESISMLKLMYLQRALAKVCYGMKATHSKEFAQKFDDAYSGYVRLLEQIAEEQFNGTAANINMMRIDEEED